MAARSEPFILQINVELWREHTYIYTSCVAAVRAITYHGTLARRQPSLQRLGESESTEQSEGRVQRNHALIHRRSTLHRWLPSCLYLQMIAQMVVQQLTACFIGWRKTLYQRSAIFMELFLNNFWPVERRRLGVQLTDIILSHITRNSNFGFRGLAKELFMGSFLK